MIEGEKIFNGTWPIKYLFQQATTDCKFLIIVFSGFPSEGKPPCYNYIKTLKNINCNKLFILDDFNYTHSSGATYYLGYNRDFSVEMSTIALITKIANEHDIPHKNIIAVGTSKGGFASLYFGLKYSFGYVISGGAQTLLGSYLLWKGSTAKEVAAFIAGGIDEECKTFLNKILFDVIEEAKNPPFLYIHVGRGDHHYQGHVLPLTECLKTCNIPYELDIAEYDGHAQLVNYFPKYLISKINDIFLKHKRQTVIQKFVSKIKKLKGNI